MLPAARVGVEDGRPSGAVIAPGPRRRPSAGREAEITIDGAPAPFVVVGSPPALWVAVRRHGGLTVTVSARQIDPASLTIEPIADPPARLLGPEPDGP